MHTAWRRTARGNGVEPPIELRFVDLFMILVTTLIFITVILSLISAAIPPAPDDRGTDGGAPRIVSGDLPAALVGRPYAVTLAACADAAAYRWELVAGRLPENLALDPATGVIAGVPGKIEATRFTVGVEAPGGAAATAPLALAVEVARDAGGERAPLSVVAPRVLLPDAVGKAEYEARLAAAGGTPPYRWELAAGDLPPGLGWSADGVVSGTPGKWKQPFTAHLFSMRARDAAGGELVTEFMLKVVPPPKTLWRKILDWGLRAFWIMAILWWLVLIWRGGAFPGLRLLFRGRRAGG